MPLGEVCWPRSRSRRSRSPAARRSGTTTVQCPQVVNYSDAQLDAIQESLNRLPKDDALRGAMQDYETLRDDARYCANLLKEQPKGLFR